MMNNPITECHDPECGCHWYFQNERSRPVTVLTAIGKPPFGSPTPLPSPALESET